MAVSIESLVARYEDIFHTPPTWGAGAPGRVNLIGEHIDYNGGLVMPAAINRNMVAIAGPSQDNCFHLHSINFGEDYHFDPENMPSGKSENNWPDYFLAVVDQFHLRDIKVRPLSVVMEGDVPAGGGLSSSAAYEVCVANLFLAANNQSIPSDQIALLAQAAEHGPRVGVQCGIMDQFISANGELGHALKLDCGTLEYELVACDPQKVAIVVIHSTVERRLVGSAYNQRRMECEKGLEQLKQLLNCGECQYLVEFSPDQFETVSNQLDKVIARRCRHVVTEQARVLAMQTALNQNDLVAAGNLLNQSHVSLRDDYEVSCPELDAIHELANNIDGVYGCRMTGAGFGGCAVALVQPEKSQSFIHQLADQFEQRFNRRPWALETPAAAGATHWSY